MIRHEHQLRQKKIEAVICDSYLKCCNASSVEESSFTTLQIIYTNAYLRNIHHVRDPVTNLGNLFNMFLTSNQLLLNINQLFEHLKRSEEAFRKVHLPDPRHHTTTNEDILWSNMLRNTQFIPEYIRGFVPCPAFSSHKMEPRHKISNNVVCATSKA